MIKLVQICFAILFLFNCRFQNRTNEIIIEDKYCIKIPSAYEIEICEDCPEDCHVIFMMKGENKICTLYLGANPYFPTKLVPDSIIVTNCEINNLRCRYYSWSSKKGLYSKELLIKLNDDPIHEWAIFINIKYHSISFKDSQRIESAIRSLYKINEETLPVKQLTKDDSLVINRHFHVYGF